MPAEPPTGPLWIPSRERVAASNLAAFARSVGFDEHDYRSLHEWSVSNLADFWAAVWRFTEIVGERGEEVFRRDANLAACRFFAQARLNVGENLLARLPLDQPAIVAYDESGRTASLSAGDVRGAVASFAAALREAGVGVGDRVVAILPNGPEAVVAMIASASIGAVFASASPDFGVSAVLDRFGQIEPVVLVGCADYAYSGKRIDCRAKLSEIASGLATVRTRVVVGPPDGEAPAGFVAWAELLARYDGEGLAFVPLPFDHPWYVLFSSGTTGRPKCIVHRTGGVLLMHAKEHRLHCDIKPADVVGYYTTTGWMMWNWLASVLAAGATILTYDGSPTHPTPHRLFEIASAEGLTLLGVSAKFIDGLRTNQIDVAGTHDLTRLRTICSTGSPLSPESFDYVYRSVSHDVHLASISGGTDLCGCFVGGVPTLPVHSGEIQAAMLGMAVEIVDDDGRPLAAGDGPGELVCRQPFPSQPLGLWGDVPFGADGPNYRATYYERFPGSWAHGDFASWTDHGAGVAPSSARAGGAADLPGGVNGVIIHGRSDATLNPAGVRIGTADLYRVVEAMPEIVESIAFGQQRDNDVRIVLAVRTAPGEVLDDALIAAVKTRIRDALSPRHVPAVILAVGDLPRTFSGKLVELAVADAVNGRPVRNRDSIANPQALDAIAGHPALR